MSNYIYIRTHEAYDLYNACKLGRTTDLFSRDNTYATSELKRGQFSFVYQIINNDLDSVEKILQQTFNKVGYNIKFDAGCEFYNKDIINNIELVLKFNDIQYIKLSTIEIKQLLDVSSPYKNVSDPPDGNTIQETIKEKSKTPIKYKTPKQSNQLRTPKSKHTPKNINPSQDIIVPRSYQVDIINEACEKFKENDKGILVLMCGVGKTYISLWISQQLQCKKILIGVPNITLLDQWEHNIYNIFPTTKILKVYSEGEKSIDNIKSFIKSNDTFIILTSYLSADKIFKASKSITDFKFDIIINDECHHLTSLNFEENGNRRNTDILKIQTIKQLSLTATLKTLENKVDMNDLDIIVSNDNKEFFGDVFVRRSLLWAIENNIICDYKVQTIVSNKQDFDNDIVEYIENDNTISNDVDYKLFMSAFVSLKTIFDSKNQDNEKSNHILVYTNNKDNADRLNKHIQKLLLDNYFNFDCSIYNNVYHSELKDKKRKEIISNFKESRFSIITCVYCLGEGWDFPELDGVVFAENMSSNIRIVQSSLRSCRKNKAKPNKVSKLILPMLFDTNFDNDTWLNESEDYKKIREIIYRLAVEDKGIEQKISITSLKPKKITHTRDFIENEKPLKISKYNAEILEKLNLSTKTRIELSGEITYHKCKDIIKSYYVQDREIFKYSLTNSKILAININGVNINLTSWSGIIKFILKQSKPEVLENIEEFKEIKKNKIEEKGFKYDEELNLSIRGVDSNNAMKIIINLIKLNNYDLYMKIRLNTDEEKEVKINKMKLTRQKYKELAEKDNRLPANPDEVYKRNNFDWFDYLFLNRNDFYTLEECRNKIKEYIDINTIDVMNYHTAIDKLCGLDNKFPPDDLWEQCYSKPLYDILPRKKKQIDIAI